MVLVTVALVMTAMLLASALPALADPGEHLDTASRRTSAEQSVSVGAVRVVARAVVAVEV